MPKDVNSELLESSGTPTNAPREIPLPGVTFDDILELKQASPDPVEPLPSRDGMDPRNARMEREPSKPEDLLDAYWRLSYTSVDNTTGQVTVSETEREQYWHAMLTGANVSVTVEDSRHGFRFCVRDLTNREVDLALACVNDESRGQPDEFGVMDVMTRLRFYQLALGLLSTGYGHAWQPFVPDWSKPRAENIKALREFVDREVKPMSGIRWNYFSTAVELASVKLRLLADAARTGFFSGASGTE